MWFTWIFSNWKLVLLGLLLLVISGLTTAYLWQRTSLIAVQDKNKQLEMLSEQQQAQIEVQKQNLIEIAKHQKRVQIVEKEVNTIREIIREVPQVGFGGDCAKDEETRKKDAEKLRIAAGNISDYFNTRRVPQAATNSSGGGEVLSQTDKAGIESSAESK